MSDGEAMDDPRDDPSAVPVTPDDEVSVPVVPPAATASPPDAVEPPNRLQPPDLPGPHDSAGQRNIPAPPVILPAPPFGQPGPGPPAAPPRRASYIGRHWRGELSLPMAYWLSSILVGTATTVPALALRVFDVTRAPRLWALGAIALWLFLVPAQVWYLVGTWRSSGAHADRGGTLFWAGVARMMVVIGWLALTWTLVARLGPQVAEFARIAFGESEIASSRVRVIRDGTEVEVNGTLGFGMAVKFRRALDDNPSIRVVHLNSNGGRSREAMALARAIGDRELVTYVATSCVSACVVAFAAGRERWLARDAVIGLHSPSFPGMLEREALGLVREERAYLVGRGVDPAFLDRGYATPHEEMWHPTHREIFAARLATAYAPPGSVGVSGASEREIENVEEALAALPVYPALKEVDPGAHAGIMKTMEEGFRSGRPLDEIRSETFPLVAAVFTRSLPHASDAALRRFGELLVAQGRALQETDGAACAALFAGNAPLETLQTLPKELRTRELEVQAEVMLSAVRDPQPTPAMSDVQAGLDAALEAMPPDARAFMSRMSDPQAQVTQPDLYCETVITFYEAILARPTDEAGRLLRASYGDVP